MNKKQAIVALDKGISKKYLWEIRRIPLLTLEQEITLSKEVKEGSELARQKLICSNLRLVIAVAKRYKRLGIPFDDLIQEGNLGLFKAVERFDWRKGYRFSTYAVWWIRHGIIRGFVERGRIIRLPSYVNDLLIKWITTEEMLVKKFKRIPTDKEVWWAAKLSKKEGKLAKDWLEVEFVSFEAEANKNEYMTNSQLERFNSTFLSQRGGFFEHLIGSKESLQRIVLPILDMLSEREQEVLKLRFGIIGNKSLTLEAIGRKLSISRERVRQIEKNALAKLQKSIAKQ